MFIGFSDSFKSGSNLMTISDKEYVIFNKKNCFTKFLNACTHRCAKLFLNCESQKTIRCSYHNAAYSPDTGKIINYNMFENRLISDTLFEFKILDNTCGLLHEPNVKLPSEITELLQDVSFTSITSMKHSCNFSLLIENVLEIEHVSSIHPSSFVPIGMKSNSPFEIDTNDWGSVLKVFNSEGNVFYLHYFVYPNLFVSVTDDLIGYIAIVDNVDNQNSVLNYRFFNGPKLKIHERIAFESYFSEAKRFTNKVLNEDKVIVESQQENINHKTDMRLFGPHDERLLHYITMERSK